MPRTWKGFISRPLSVPKRSSRNGLPTSSTTAYRPRYSLSYLPGPVKVTSAKLGAEEIAFAVALLPGRRRRRRGAGGAEAAGGGLHRLVLPGRDFEVHRPDLGRPEDVLAGRLLPVGRQARRHPEADQGTGQRGGRGKESSAHRSTSRSRVRR